MSAPEEYRELRGHPVTRLYGQPPLRPTPFRTSLPAQSLEATGLAVHDSFAKNVLLNGFDDYREDAPVNVLLTDTGWG